MEIPKLIFTHLFQVGGKSEKVELPGKEFIKLVQGLESKVVFYHVEPESHRFLIFIIHQGVYFYPRSNVLEPLEEFFQIEKGGFPSIKEYLMAYRIGLNNFKDYSEYRETNFFDQDGETYQAFLDAKKKGFTDRNEYNSAIKEGIPNKEEFDAYRASNIYTYENFLNFKKGGFKDKYEFEKALELGIDNVNDYYEHLKQRVNEKIKELTTVPNRIQLSKLREAVSMDTNTFNSKVLEWAKDFGFTIDGEDLVLSEGSLTEFLEELDKKYDLWEKMNGKKL